METSSHLFHLLPSVSISLISLPSVSRTSTQELPFEAGPERNGSQPHKGHLISKLNSNTVSVLPSLDPSLIFPFLLLTSPAAHPTGFSFCFFPGFLAIFTLLSSSNNNNMMLVHMEEEASPYTIDKRRARRWSLTQCSNIVF